MLRCTAANEPPRYTTRAAAFPARRFTLCRWQRMTTLLRITAVFFNRGIGVTIDLIEATCLK